MCPKTHCPLRSILLPSLSIASALAAKGPAPCLAHGSSAAHTCGSMPHSQGAAPQSRLAAPVLLVALAASAPWLLYEPPAGSLKRRRSLPPWAGLLHAACAVAAVINARFALFDALAWLGGRPPSEGLLLGGLLLAAVGGCAPLVARFYLDVGGPRRTVLLGGVLGAVLVLLQPPLPIQVLPYVRAQQYVQCKGGSGLACTRSQYQSCRDGWTESRRLHANGFLLLCG